MNQEEETAFEAIQRLQEYISTSGEKKFGNGIMFMQPVYRKDIEKLEKKLNTQFSPSYVQFLTENGTFQIDGGRYKLLTPAEALKETKRQWDYYKKYLKDNPVCDDSDTLKVFQLYFFQIQKQKSDFFVFYLDETFINGEMTVHPFFHSDIFYLANNRIDFNKHISKLVDRLIAEDIQDMSIL